MSVTHVLNCVRVVYNLHLKMFVRKSQKTISLWNDRYTGKINNVNISVFLINMSLRHSSRPLPRAQRAKHSIRDIAKISANLEIVLAFLTCLTESNIYESSQEAIECLEDFQGEIDKSVRRLQFGAQKLTDLTDPEDILEKISKSPTQRLCCNIMQAALDAMATADSMYHLQKDQDDLIAGLWAVIFLLAANVAGKLCDLTIPNVPKKEQK